MPKLIYRVYKTAFTGTSQQQWKNEYVLDCDYSITSDEVEHDALALAFGESALHLSSTTYYLVTVGVYGDQANSALEQTERVWPLMRWNLTGARVANDPAPDNIGLMLKKQVVGGRNGKALFFGSLNTSDYVVRDNDEIVLTNLSQLTEALDYGLYLLNWSGLLGRLVVPQLADVTQHAWDFRPGRLMIGYPVKANARKRASFNRRAKARGAFDKVIGNLQAIALRMQQLRESFALGHDFQPDWASEAVQAAITGTVAAASYVTEWLQAGETDQDGNKIYPVPRFGPQPDAMKAMYPAWQGRADQDLETVAKLGPYIFVDGQRYTHWIHVRDLLDIVKPWEAKAAELADFDYFTPYYLPSD